LYELFVSVFLQPDKNKQPIGETMKKTLSLLAVLMTAGVAATPVQAANHYVSALAGYSWLNDSDVTYASDYIVGGSVSTSRFDGGVTGVVAVGCDFGDTRLEAEAGYQQNDWSGIWDGMTAGKSSVYSLMANGFYDIPLGGEAEIYGMAGAGIAQVNFEGNYEAETYSGPFPAPPTTTLRALNFKSHATTFAYQLGAGITVPLSKGVKLDARYRYFATTDFTFSGPEETSLGSNPAGTDFATNWYSPGYNTNVSSHSVLLGLRVDI
jgi:opacity protein-like surface antigen